MNQARSVRKAQYVKAGSQAEENSRFQVSRYVFLYNEGEREERETFRAEREASEGMVRGLALKWAALIMVLAVALSSWMVGSRAALTVELNEAYANLCSRFVAADAEGRSLLAELAEKNDASKICYYAVQNLGMRLATHEETIGVTAQAAVSAARLDAARTGSLANSQ